MEFLKPIFSLLILHFVISSPFLLSAIDDLNETFNEELLLKPLPDRKVLAHFHFASSANLSFSNGGSHLRIFPKSISQLVHKFHITEMELSFTQGRWNYERWGGFDPISSSNAKPPGVELWAVFDAPPSQVDALWKNLTNTLSGLFCASINFLESSTSYSAPNWGFRSSSGSLRYGSLPREAVCTENLTPWLKLLPCRDKAGLSELMDRPSIYRGYYHSQRLHLVSSIGSDDVNSEIQLEQTLTVVLQPVTQKKVGSHISNSRLQPNWSLSSIFGRKVNEKCALAKSSNIYLQFDRALVSELESILTKNSDTKSKNSTFESSVENPVVELSTIPDKVIKEVGNIKTEQSSILYLFLIERHTNGEPFDLALTWKLPVVWSSSNAPFLASRFLTGSGNERGAIVISLKSVGRYKRLMDNGDKCIFNINVFQVVPWYIKVYYHTLRIYIDGKIQPTTNITDKIRVSPSEDKVSPGVLELSMRFPCGMKSASFSVDFDKGFLHINEYPPDANQGFDIPSAIISFPDFYSNHNFAEESNLSPLVSRLQVRSPALVYTEVLLVPLTTPDFSMPYNVITITCTVFALYFGSILNILRYRADEEERLLKEKANGKVTELKQTLRKLLARLKGKAVIVMVALIGIAWHFYFG